MADEITKLRQELAEARLLTREEQRRREEAELPSRLPRSVSIHVVTERSLTTQGETTNPAGRLYPKRITPWDDFPTRQEGVWKQLEDSAFLSERQFPSRHQMDYVQSLNAPISSEIGLRSFERDTVEHAVQKIIHAIYENQRLRDRLRLRGFVSFESHTNLGVGAESMSDSLERVSLKARPRARGKGNRADQFCIYRTSDGTSIPATAIEYKAPHKLSQEEVITGLVSEIEPERDVIGKDDESFAFAAKALATAVITQLFSYMVGKGIQYGYVCTGQTFIFLHIADDPSTVYYYVCVPNLDVRDDDKNRLHRTAVAQVLAFTLQALRSTPPPPSWYDAAANLDLWAVEYEQVLSKIPVSTRKERKQYASPYNPPRWRGFQRSPVRTRSHCQQPGTRTSPRDSSSDDDTLPPSPITKRVTRSGRSAAGPTASSSAQDGQRRDGDGAGEGIQRSIQERPYCTHQCLLGLASGGALDEACPNVSDHGSKHLPITKLAALISAQIARDRGSKTDSAPLYLAGSLGALFKICLSTHGYTVVAKGVEEEDGALLAHEVDIYAHLRSIQGKYIPVCLGMVRLDLPMYYDNRTCRHLMLLSYAGRPLPHCNKEIKEDTTLVSAIARAFTCIHQLHVLHGDPTARNVTYGDCPMVVDFEKAKISRLPLGAISPNKRKRTHGNRKLATETDPFVKEQQTMLRRVERFLGEVLHHGNVRGSVECPSEAPDGKIVTPARQLTYARHGR